MNFQQREQAASQVFLLAVACPHANGNSSDCPFYRLRQLPVEERINWARALPDEDLEYLIIYCQICLQLMSGGEA
jgi:hypothetical protein